MILDANALSAFADGDVAIESRIASAAFAAIPVIALGEYRFGFMQSKRRAAYEEWFAKNDRYLEFLSIDKETALTYAEIRLELKRAGTPIPVNDLWIAALARQHRMPVLSRDRHFDAVKGVRRLTW